MYRNSTTWWGISHNALLWKSQAHSVRDSTWAKVLTERFWEFQSNIAWWKCYQHASKCKCTIQINVELHNHRQFSQWQISWCSYLDQTVQQICFSVWCLNIFYKIKHQEQEGTMVMFGQTEIGGRFKSKNWQNWVYDFDWNRRIDDPFNTWSILR